MLTLTFLGVGSAFAKRNFQSNALIEAWSLGPDRQDVPDDTLLVDFGGTGPLALEALNSKPGFAYLDRDGGINYPAIRRVFITHLHGDHIAGLEELAVISAFKFSPADGGARLKPEIISSMEILASLWTHSLRGGLGMLPGRSAFLQDYFRIRAVRPPGDGGLDRFHMLERYEFTVFATDHIRLQRRFDWPSLGLLITDCRTGSTVTFSGDTRFDPDGLGKLMDPARLNFHEVQLEDDRAQVHALLSELRTLPKETRKKTYLYHYGDAWNSGAYDFVADEFAGFAHPQERYLLFDHLLAD